MVLIAVHGRASVRLAAERGVVRLSVEREHEDRATVLEQATALHERLTGEAQAFVAAGEAEEWSSDQVQVRAEYRYEGARETRRLVQVAAVQLQVRFRDLAALSSWVQRTGTDVGAVVHGVDWSVTPEAREAAQRAARRGAVLDAVQRAQDYADAIGGGDPVLVAMWEDGLRPGSGSTGTGGWTAQSKAVGDTGPALVLRPDAIDVSAGVTADFEVPDPGPSHGRSSA